MSFYIGGSGDSFFDGCIQGLRLFPIFGNVWDKTEWNFCILELESFSPQPGCSS